MGNSDRNVIEYFTSQYLVMVKFSNIVKIIGIQQLNLFFAETTGRIKHERELYNGNEYTLEIIFLNTQADKRFVT